jgi:hypothetical protein
LEFAFKSPPSKVIYSLFFEKIRGKKKNKREKKKKINKDAC